MKLWNSPAFRQNPLKKYEVPINESNGVFRRADTNYNRINEHDGINEAKLY